jgi:Transglycosylase SLT domain
MLKKFLRLTFYFLPLIAFAANFTESSAEVAMPLSTENSSLPVKVIIHKAHPGQFAAPSRTLSIAFKAQGNKSEAQAVKAYVRSEALEHGVNPKLALWIVKHESQFNPYAKGDGEASRGLWQISKIYHPEVSDAAAFNVASSTEWSLERIRSGKANEWSTYRFCKTLYVDCPF